MSSNFNILFTGQSNTGNNLQKVTEFPNDDVIQICIIHAGDYRETIYYLKKDGTAYSKGHKHVNGFLYNSSIFQQVITSVSPITGVKKIAATQNCVFLLLRDGTVLSTGNDTGNSMYNYELGISNSVYQRSIYFATCKKNDGTILEDIIDIVPGTRSLFALTKDRRLYVVGGTTRTYTLCTGLNTTVFLFNLVTEDGTIGGTPITNVTKIATGDNHSLIYRDSSTNGDGKLYGCGANKNYIGLNYNSATNFSEITQDGTSSGTSFSQVAKIGCGYRYSILLKYDGTIFGAGVVVPGFTYYSPTFYDIKSNNIPIFKEIVPRNKGRLITDINDFSIKFKLLYLRNKEGIFSAGIDLGVDTTYTGNYISSNHHTGYFRQLLSENDLARSIKISDELLDINETTPADIEASSIQIILCRSTNWKLGKLNIYVNEGDILNTSDRGYGTTINKSLFISFYQVPYIYSSDTNDENSNANRGIEFVDSLNYEFTQNPQSLLDPSNNLPLFGSSSNPSRPIYFKLQSTQWTPEGNSKYGYIEHAVKYTFDPSTEWVAGVESDWNYNKNCIPKNLTVGDSSTTSWGSTDSSLNFGGVSNPTGTNPANFIFHANKQYLAVIHRISENSIEYDSTEPTIDNFNKIDTFKVMPTKSILNSNTFDWISETLIDSNDSNRSFKSLNENILKRQNKCWAINVNRYTTGGELITILSKGEVPPSSE